VWQQFQDLQNKQREDEEIDEDIPIEDRFELADDDLRDTGVGQEWYEDTEIDKGEYDQMIIEDGEVYQELDGKRPIKGKF
jgi:hypothetical protein